MHGRAVGQKEELAAAVRLGQHGVEVLQHVQLQVERLAVVHVRQILAAPAEGFAAGNDLQAGGVDAPGLEHGGVFRRPILAHHAGQPHGGEEAGRVGEEHGRAAQHVVALLGGRFDAVQSDGTDDA